MLDAQAFCVKLSRLGSAQKLFRFKPGSGLAQLEVQNLNWARARNENYNMSQAQARFELKKFGLILPARRFSGLDSEIVPGFFSGLPFIEP